MVWIHRFSDEASVLVYFTYFIPPVSDLMFAIKIT